MIVALLVGLDSILIAILILVLLATYGYKKGIVPND